MLPQHIKVIFIIAFELASCAVVHPRNEPPCNVGNDYFTSGPECYNFYSCRNGVLEIIECPPGLLWNNFILRCDAAENVVCQNDGTTTTPPPTAAPTSPSTTSPPSNTLMPSVEGALPILLPGSQCSGDIPQAFLIHETDCRRFFYCFNGIQYPQVCPLFETFNFVLGHCVPRDPMFCYPGSV
ncbi:peritrophin-1 [Anopheles nili]|uniref:peritrophin-1 n=1 Tax=Anopheles nili TaxID=185578 RepID=UPI00237BCA66|nr:peritrophin-1 [Anopheles nili]